MLRAATLTAAALFCASTLATSLAAAPALALNWRVAPNQSQIAFRYEEDGAAAVGRFEKFEGSAEFDAARPERARLDLKIAVGSIKLSDRFRSDFVKTESWFDAQSFPFASFELDKIALAAGQEPAAPGAARTYDVEGVLTIKGASRPIRTQIDLTLESRTARAVGRVAFDRSDFKVGDALGGFFVDVGDEIAVEFDIIANRI